MSKVWSAEQTYHGGQEHSSLSNFVEDFSVTCNALGTPSGALAAAQAALAGMEHYPAADQQPALGDLADHIFGAGTDLRRDAGKRFILGNGASELIDLVTRLAPEGPWRPGPNAVQYKEYERAAKACDREVSPHGPGAGSQGGILAIVNPCNPTGDVLLRKDLQALIEKSAADNSFVIVDESMLMWLGPRWRDESLMTDPAWVTGLLETRGVAVHVMVSWTKIWACPGVRIGSLLCPSEDHLSKLKRKMVPWSVNVAALAFISKVVRDEEYMEKTWERTPEWRAALSEAIAEVAPSFKVHGEPYLSWIWVDCGSEAIAAAVVDTCRAAGTPVRWGKFGYNLPQFVRFGVRDPIHYPIIKAAIKAAIDKQ